MQMQPDVRGTASKWSHQARPFGTSEFTLDENRRNLISTGGPAWSHRIELQDEHEAEATGPVDEISEAPSETEDEEYEKKMIKEFLSFKNWKEKGRRSQKKRGHPFAEQRDGRGADERSEDKGPNKIGRASCRERV